MVMCFVVHDLVMCRLKCCESRTISLSASKEMRGVIIKMNNEFNEIFDGRTL